jgi:hypothetical protein
VLSRLSKLKEYKFGELIEDMERQQTALAESRQHGRPGGNRGVHTKTNAKFTKATTCVRDGLLGKALQELTKADAADLQESFHARGSNSRGLLGRLPQGSVLVCLPSVPQFNAWSPGC